MNQPNYPSEFCFVKDEEEEEGEGFCRFNSNPLVAPSPKIEMGLLGDGSYDDFSIAASNWNLQRPQSSEATMSEEDQELARFYLNGSTD